MGNKILSDRVLASLIQSCDRDPVLGTFFKTVQDDTAKSEIAAMLIIERGYELTPRGLRSYDSNVEECVRTIMQGIRVAGVEILPRSCRLAIALGKVDVEDMSEAVMSEILKSTGTDESFVAKLQGWTITAHCDVRLA